MTKRNPQTLVTALVALALLSLASPLLSRNARAQDHRAQNTRTANITLLLEKLKTADEFNRDETVEDLVKLGAPAVPKLIETLQSENFLVRQAARDALTQIGSPAVPALIKALQSKDVRVRWNAATALRSVGNSNPNAFIPALVKQLKDSDRRVRIGAAESLMIMSWQWYGQEVPSAAIDAIPKLKAALKDREASVRWKAVIVLGNMGDKAIDAIPELKAALKDQDVDVRRRAVTVLEKMGDKAIDAIPDLKAALKDRDADVRSSAADALGNMGDKAIDAIPELKAALKDREVSVRRTAVTVLEKMGDKAIDAIPELKATLKDQDADVRKYAALALGKMGDKAIDAIPELKAALKDQYADVRQYAALALANMGDKALDAIPELKAALKDQYADVRRSAALALGKMGDKAIDAIPELKAVLKDQDVDVRYYAAYALGNIAVSFQDNASTLTLEKLNRAISELESALKILSAGEKTTGKQNSSPQFSKETINNLRRPLDILKEKRSDRLFIKAILLNPWLWGGGLYLISLLGLFAFRPLWLLKLYEFLKPIGFKIPVLGTDVSLGFLMFLKYHPRVLDAWVAAHVKAAQGEFQQRETVSDRAVLVPVPVSLNNNTLAELTSKDLQSTFNQNRGCLLIWGEGGAGKTSRACQIAKWAMSDNPGDRICHHRMLPVLIEEELNSKVADGKQPFIETIRGQLQDLTDKEEPISEEFLERLLRQRRILVIVDHFSEMSEATQAAIKPEMPDFLVNALLVTSRIEEPLGRVTKTTMKPQRIAGNGLSSFMDGYLSQQTKRDLFTDEEFFKACLQLSEIVRDRNITVLLAKLYADQLIATKESTTESDLPDNIPELMLHYLNQLNRTVTGEKFSDSLIQQDAKALAWECLKPTYRPAAASRQGAIAAIGGNDGELRLKYLDEKLRLIQSINVAHNLRFSLEPLAEYLAGLHLVEIYGNDNNQWQSFLNDADSQNAPEAIKGFLLAVRDCYLAKIPGAKESDFLPNELKRRSGISVAVASSQAPQTVSTP